MTLESPPLTFHQATFLKIEKRSMNTSDLKIAPFATSLITQTQMLSNVTRYQDVLAAAQ